MICTTLTGRDLDGIYDALETPGMEMAEIRLDTCPLDAEDIEELFSDSDVPLVATCRIGENMPAKEAEARLIRAIQAGAAYVDVELEAPAMMSKRIRREARECGTILIRSYHDFTGTDSQEALKALVEKCLHLGAEVVKIVTTAHGPADTDRILSLYKDFEPGQLIAFCMGEEGKGSRLECLRCGAPFSYAALNAHEVAAPGQWTLPQMSEAVYGDLRMVGYSSMEGPKPLRMPASKSFAQRAIIAAALADGTSRLTGYSPCGDSESAIAAIQALGAKVTRRGRTLTITGGIHADVPSLHVGESGFLTRMMIPILAQLSRGEVTLTGEKTLLTRPLMGAREIMDAFGVTLSGSDPDSQPQVPVTVHGPLRGGQARIGGRHGSQLISGLLAALPLGDTDTTLFIEEPKSIPYIFMTIDVLKQFGIRIESEMEGDEEFLQTQDWDHCSGITLRIPGRQHYHPAEIALEGDWSSAANFMVAGAVFGRVDLVGLDTSSLQADLCIMDILMDAGASMSALEDENSLHVQRAPLNAFEVDAGNCPDLFPILSVLAAFCQGTSRISGAGRLLHKESNRAQAILDMLAQMGVRATLKGDTLSIEGRSLVRRLLTGTLLKGGKYTSHHDHRMLMALKVASLGADGPIEIDDTECVAKSFPSFFDLFAAL